MKVPFTALLSASSLLLFSVGCGSQNVDVVDLNKVIDALVAVLDEKGAAKGIDAGTATIAASDGNAEVSSTAEIQALEPDKQNPALESSFLKSYTDKLNEMKAMNTTVGVSMTAGGEIIGFKDPNQNMIQDLDETKEFSVTIDPANNRLVASDNNGYHRPHSYGFSPGGMMMGYMLGSMMGRQRSYYSGPMSPAKPSFNNTPMSPANYHKSAASSVRSTRSAGSSARSMSGSKGFSFGK